MPLRRRLPHALAGTRTAKEVAREHRLPNSVEVGLLFSAADFDVLRLVGDLFCVESWLWRLLLISVCPCYLGVWRLNFSFLSCVIFSYFVSYLSSYIVLYFECKFIIFALRYFHLAFPFFVFAFL